uniref:Integrase catalytic domain-containing protein n=1 Tax=Fagus sylvatica TaxID=28930 RepID=A0A2N9FTU5_FAGSY
MASANSSLNIPSNQSPLLLLNNMSNLMSTKLDSSNFMIWKLQITAVLDAYSMLDHLDGSIPKPDQFLTAETGIQAVNPEFLVWSKKDKALLSLLYSTCSSSVLAMVVGKSSSQEVWNTLEERFTSTARSSVLNLKLELQSIKKSGNESVSSYLQRIKSVRDKLSAVGVHSDQEELTHVILKGLPKEYAPFASAIRTRDTVLSLERLTVLLQTEEQSMNEITDSLPNSALAMFVSHNKPHFNGNQGSNRGRGRNSYSRGRGRNSSFNQSFSSPNPSSQYVPQYQQQQQISSTTQSPQATYQGKNERPTCQICWKMGHYAIDCYNRMNFAYQGKNPTTKLAAMASASNLHYTQGAETWLTDTGATDHITANANNLSPQAPYQGQEQVSVGNGQNLPIQNIGNSQLHTKYHKFQLRNVLHVPKIASNLLSVHKLCLDNNCSCYFDAKKLLIQDLPTGRLLYKGQSSNGVYPIQSHLFHSIANKTACVAHSISSDKWHLWHSRLGHPSSNVLHNIFPCFSTVPNSKSVIEHCHHCLAGKMHQLPFPISNKTVTSPFELIHADLWGPAPVTASNCFRFYLVFVDEFTKFTWVYLLKHKSDTFQVFTQFRAMIETQFSLPIKILRTDCGGEFLSTPFNQFCSSKGIIHQLSCPHTPQQNGVAERKHRHLVQCALALLSQSKLPLSYWSYAISTAAHIINKLPTPNLGNQSPWDALYQVAPDLSHLRTFGCECFPLLTPYNSHKLLPKTTPCVFLGYPLHTKGYYCLDPVITPFLPPGFSRVSARKTRQPEPSRSDPTRALRIKYSQEEGPRHISQDQKLDRTDHPLTKPIWEATFAQRFSPTRCNLVREPRPLGKRFTSATTRNFRIVKSSSGQAGISVQKLTPWHKEHSDGLRSQDHISRTQARLCARPVPLKSRVFLTRNKLICEPGHIGKRTHPCTTWNSRIAKNLSGSAGILIGKLPSNGPKTPRCGLCSRGHISRVQARIPANPEPCKNRQRKLSDGTKNVKIRHRELGQICARTGTRFEKKRAGSKTHFFSRTAAFARRVFPARNKLIREPGCVGKIMTPATSWNSRFAESIPRLIGIFARKSARKQLRYPDFREP